MSQCCGKIPDEEDVHHIRDSIENAYQEQIDYYHDQIQIHEEIEQNARRELEQLQNEETELDTDLELELLHNDVVDERSKEAEADLQKIIDEERGHVAFWQTKTEQLEGVGTHEKGTFMRSIPQQNMKDEKGDHTFYDPRNGRSGVAFGDSPRKSKD